VLAAVVVGYAAMRLLFPADTTDEDLARDLRVIENKRIYEHIDDLEFLKELAHPDLFGDDGG
jgi:hypothetical protein